MLLPLAWAIVSSLKPLEAVYAFPPQLTVRNPQWSNYVEAFTRLPVGRFLVNSLVIAMASMTGAVVSASLTGYALARLRFRGRRLCFALVMISMFIPAHALMVPRFMLYDVLGWVNTYKPLIVPAWLGGGAFNIFLFRQFFRSIPRDLEDAALLDGANHWQVFRLVMLPMARPAVVAVGVLSFVFHWQAFLDPLIYLSDFETFPITLGLRMYQSMAGTWANLLMATAVIALVPVTIIFLLGERSMMRGLGVVQSQQP